MREKLVVVLLLFLLFSSLLVISNNNIYIFEEGGLASFGKFYFSWFASLGSNLASFTGNVIKSDNSSNSEKL